MTKFEKFCRPLTHTSFAYYLARFFFKHKIWSPCHRANHPLYGSGWCFLGRFHPDDNSAFLVNYIEN